MISRTMSLLVVLSANSFGQPQIIEDYPSHAAGNIQEVVLGLLCVIATIFIISWLVKKFKLNLAIQGPIKTIAVNQINHTSRVMLIELNEQQYLIGVTPHQIQLIDRLEQPLEHSPVSFSQKLHQASQS